MMRVNVSPVRNALFAAAAFIVVPSFASAKAGDPGALDSREIQDAPATTAAASPTPAQDSRSRTERRPRERSESEMAANVPQVRDETFRLMDAYLISNLQESLGLTDDQFTRALPIVKKLQADRREFARRRMTALRVLRRSLGSGTVTESAVTDLLKDLKAASEDERAGTLRNLEALDAVLTPLQQAKYRVFEAEIDSRLRHLLARSQDRNQRR